MGQKTDRSRRRSSSDGAKSRKKRKQPRGVELGRYYHWHGEPDLVRLSIDLGYVRKVVKHEMARYGTVNMYSFLREKGLNGIYLLLTGKKGSTSVVILKRFCKEFNVDLKDIEKKCIILNPRIFPIDMSSKAFIKLKSHVFNEGRIAFRKKSVGRLGYSNQDPVLLRYFTDLVKELGGDIRGEPRFSRYVLSVEASPVLARALDASGLPSGRKTRTNPALDHLLESNEELFRYHIKATLVEEGWCTLILTRDRRIQFVIAWGRSVDITDKLTKEQVEDLRQIVQIRGKRKIPIRSIKIPELQNTIRENPPRSFDMEVDLLNFSHKKILKHGGYPTKVNLSKDDRVTVFWELHFSKPEEVDIIYNEYGMLPETWKARRLENLYEAFVRYRGRRLTDEEISEIRKIKEDNPPKVSAEWISGKMRELFPSIEWGADVEWIRKKLGRKESK